MKSKIIVFLLLLATTVGCGQSAEIDDGEDGGQSPSPELNQDGDQDQGEDGEGKDKDEKDKDEKDNDDNDDD